MTIWGPNEATVNPEIPFSNGIKSDKVWKLADWTRSSSEPLKSNEDLSFSTVDRIDTALRKNAMKSTRPVFRKQPLNQDEKKNVRHEKQKPRESSIKVGAAWKQVEELEFTRMTSLQFEPSEPVDLEVCGKLRYYDANMNKISIKSDVHLKQPTWEIPNPSASSDSLLQSFKYEKNTIICTDTALTALMTSTRSIYSWDMVVTKSKNRLVFDKRDNGPLDFETVNENAADPPNDEKDNESSINSREALGFEATSINKAWCEHCTTQEKLEFGGKTLPVNENVSRAFRYRKYELDDTILVVRSTIHAAVKVATGSIGDIPVTKSDFSLAETCLVNTYALNEFDYRSQGAGGAFDWRKKLETQKGGVLATEFKNNACKLSRWTMQSILSGVDEMKIAFVSRITPRDRKRHQILSTSTFEPFDFGEKIGLDQGNAWGIVKAISDLFFQMEDDGTFIIVRHPVRSSLIIHKVQN